MTDNSVVGEYTININGYLPTSIMPTGVSSYKLTVIGACSGSIDKFTI